MLMRRNYQSHIKVKIDRIEILDIDTKYAHIKASPTSCLANQKWTRLQPLNERLTTTKAIYTTI